MKKSVVSQSLVGVIIAIAAVYYFSGGFQSDVKKTMQDASSSAAEDTIEEYRIVSRDGDKMQMCVISGIIAEQYLGAKDVNKYHQWKDINKRDCKAAGVPQ